MKELLIFVDTKTNKNKFYQIELVGNKVSVEYGRVGNSTPQRRDFFGGELTYNKKRKEKMKKGYILSEIDVNLLEEDSPISNIMDISMSQIKTDDISKKLIAELVEQNIHNITSTTKIKYDIKSGYFKTDLGIVTKKGVDKAIQILNNLSTYQKAMGKLSDKKFAEFVKLNESYFSIIPTKIKNLRDHKNLLITEEKITDQLNICDSLSKSLKIISDAKKVSKTSSKEEDVFNVSVTSLKKGKEFNRIVKYFNDSKNSKHGHNSYKIDKIYNIKLGEEDKLFRDNLSNQMELFHGTKIANLLSILKSGLLMPKYSPGSSTGYMFGQGLYFANQSTKSLNYCDGMYWNSSKKQDKIYMFIADVAMGNYQVPDGNRSKKPSNGYDSYWAKPGQSGIQNDEMIVFNNDQIRLKYILEIGK